MTGAVGRQWLEYADGIFEPVRKDENLNKKYHDNKRSLDWWVVDKPTDWNPLTEGKKVSLNHDYGQEGKPGAKVSPKPLGTARPGDSERNRQTMELRYEDMGKHKPQLFASKTTLGQGAAALQEYEAKLKAAESQAPSSPQSAAALNKWERELGFDPDQNSGHGQRPPSSSRDAARLEKADADRGRREYTRWLWEMKNDPPWKSKEKTPTEKVQSVTHPLGEEVGMTMLEQLLKGSASPIGMTLGLGLKGAGPLLDLLTNPEDAW